MPNWKKVILSGSNAALNNVTVNNLTVAGTFSGTTGDSAGIVTGKLIFFYYG